MGKNIFCIIMLLMIVTMAVSCTTVTPVTESKTAAEASRRYPELESAVIKYNVSGMNTGTEEVYIDDWGRREAIYTKITAKMMGVVIEKNTMTLITENGKWVYKVDLNARTAIKMNNQRYKALGGNTGNSIEGITGALNVGKEEVVGRTCDVWKKSYPYNMVWIWKGIALKKDKVVAEMGVHTVATDVKESVSITDDKFTIPSDVKIKILDTRALIGN